MDEMVSFISKSLVVREYGFVVLERGGIKNGMIRMRINNWSRIKGRNQSLVFCFHFFPHFFHKDRCYIKDITDKNNICAFLQ